MFSPSAYSVLWLYDEVIHAWICKTFDGKLTANYPRKLLRRKSTSGGLIRFTCIWVRWLWLYSKSRKINMWSCCTPLQNMRQIKWQNTWILKFDPQLMLELDITNRKRQVRVKESVRFDGNKGLCQIYPSESIFLICSFSMHCSMSALLLRNNLSSLEPLTPSSGGDWRSTDSACIRHITGNKNNI